MRLSLRFFACCARAATAHAVAALTPPLTSRRRMRPLPARTTPVGGRELSTFLLRPLRVIRDGGAPPASPAMSAMPGWRPTFAAQRDDANGMDRPRSRPARPCNGSGHRGALIARCSCDQSSFHMHTVMLSPSATSYWPNSSLSANTSIKIVSVVVRVRKLK